MTPTKKEIDEVFLEERVAFDAFAALVSEETTITKKKNAAHKRLVLAREAKRALQDDLLFV